MSMLRSVVVVMLLLCTQSSIARELIAERILSQRSGKSVGEIIHTIRDFHKIDSNSVIHVTVDLPATSDDFLAAEAFFRSFKGRFQNAHFSPSQEGIAAGDYVVFVGVLSVSDSYDRSIQDYRTEATGIDCDRRYNNRISCRQTGQRRVPSGTRVVSLTASIHGVVSDFFLVDSEGKLKEIRSGNSSISLTGSDNCRNMRNVYSSLAYMLGTQPLLDRPESLSYRAYPNQIGCYDSGDIELR